MNRIGFIQQAILRDLSTEKQGLIREIHTSYLISRPS